MELEITVYEYGVAVDGGQHEDLIHDVLRPIIHDIVLPSTCEIELKECLDGTRVFVCKDRGRIVRFPAKVLNHIISYHDGTTRRLVGDKLPLTADGKMTLLLEEWN